MKTHAKIWLGLVIAVSVSLVGCKEECRLKKDEWPQVRGVKPGMTLQLLQATYPGVPELELNKYGLSRLIFEPDSSLANGFGITRRPTGGGEQSVTAEVMDKPFPELAGVKRMIVDFFNGKVSRVQAYYEDLGWSSVDAFSQHVIQQLKLPENADWKMNKEDMTTELSCRCIESLDCLSIDVKIGFEFSASEKNGHLPFIEIMDWYPAKMGPLGKRWSEEEAEQKKQEAKQKEFRP